MFEFFVEFIKNMLLTGAYQNEVFKDPLSKEEEDYFLELKEKGDKHAKDKLIELKIVFLPCT